MWLNDDEVVKLPLRRIDQVQCLLRLGRQPQLTTITDVSLTHCKQVTEANTTTQTQQMKTKRYRLFSSHVATFIGQKRKTQLLRRK